MKGYCAVKKINCGIQCHPVGKTYYEFAKDLNDLYRLINARNDMYKRDGCKCEVELQEIK